MGWWCREGLWEPERGKKPLVGQKKTNFVKYLKLVATDWCLWLCESAL